MTGSGIGLRGLLGWERGGRGQGDRLAMVLEEDEGTWSHHVLEPCCPGAILLVLRPVWEGGGPSALLPLWVRPGHGSHMVSLSLTPPCSPCPPSPLSLSLPLWPTAFAARWAGRSSLQHWGPALPYSPSSVARSSPLLGGHPSCTSLVPGPAWHPPCMSWGGSEPLEPLPRAPQPALPVETRASPSLSKPLITFPKACLLPCASSPCTGYLCPVSRRPDTAP